VAGSYFAALPAIAARYGYNPPVIQTTKRGLDQNFSCGT